MCLLRKVILAFPHVHLMEGVQYFILKFPILFPGQLQNPDMIFQSLSGYITN